MSATRTSWIVRDDETGEDLAAFETEEAALIYGSRLANANPDGLYAIARCDFRPIAKPKPLS